MSKIILTNGVDIRLELDWSGTIAEAEKQIRDAGNVLPIIALIDGEPVLRKDGGWDMPIPEGKTLIFVELPMGGGRGGSAMAVQIVATVAAMAATAYLGGAGGAAMLGVSTTTANVVAGAVSMGIMMAGSLIASSLAKSQGQISAASAETASPTYSINASGNMARLNQPEPEGFGEIQIVPDYVSQPWTSYENNEEWGHFVYAIGRGDYELHTMSFGDTVFWKDGQFVQSTVVVSNSDEVETVVNEEITTSQYSTARVVTDNESIASTVKVKFRFPNGMYTMDSDYHIKPVTIQLAVYFAKCNAAGTPIEGYSSQILYMTYENTDAFSDTLSFALPDTGRYSMIVGWGWESGFHMLDEVRCVFESYYVPSTNVSSVANAQVEQISTGGSVSIFDDNIFTTSEVSNLSLLAPNQDSYIGYSGPYTVCPPGAQIHQIFIDYAYSNGLGKYNTDGSLKEFSVSFTVQYRKIDDASEPITNWSTMTYTDSGSTTTPQRKTVGFNVPLGRYQVRMIRTSATSLDSKQPSLDSLVWTGLRGKIAETPIYPLSCVAVKIRASNALSQQSMGQFKAVIRRKLPTYDRSTKKWSAPIVTRSWAAALCAACKEDWGGKMTDAQLDLDAIWAIDETLQAKGWHFDAYVDGAFSMWQLVLEMCQCMVTVPRLLGTKLSVIEDKAGRPVSFELSPRNIVRDSFSVSYNTFDSNSPDSIVFNYIDEAHGYQRADVTAKLRATEALSPVTLDWIGITNRAHAFRVATAYAARNRHRRITVTCQVEGLGRIINVGDVVQVNHPRFHNTGGGSITRVVPEILTAYIRRDFVPTVGGSTHFSVTLPDGSVWGPVRMSTYTEDKIVLDAADHAAYVAQGHQAFDKVLSESMDLRGVSYAVHASSSFQRRMIVQSVDVDDLWHFTVTLVNDAPEIDTYNSLAVPGWGA